MPPEHTMTDVGRVDAIDGNIRRMRDQVQSFFRSKELPLAILKEECAQQHRVRRQLRHLLEQFIYRQSRHIGDGNFLLIGSEIFL